MLSVETDRNKQLRADLRQAQAALQQVTADKLAALRDVESGRQQIGTDSTRVVVYCQRLLVNFVSSD
jgi:hypothetical protein